MRTRSVILSESASTQSLPFSLDTHPKILNLKIFSILSQRSSIFPGIYLSPFFFFFQKQLKRMISNFAKMSVRRFSDVAAKKVRAHTPDTCRPPLADLARPRPPSPALSAADRPLFHLSVFFSFCSNISVRSLVPNPSHTRVPYPLSLFALSLVYHLLPPSTPTLVLLSIRKRTADPTRHFHVRPEEAPHDAGRARVAQAASPGPAVGRRRLQDLC